MKTYYQVEFDVHWYSGEAYTPPRKTWKEFLTIEEAANFKKQIDILNSKQNMDIDEDYSEEEISLLREMGIYLNGFVDSDATIIKVTKEQIL